MKVLKSLAVLALVFTLGACKTAPGEEGGSTLDKGLNEAIDGVGNTAGLTRYNLQEKEVQGNVTFDTSESFFINLSSPSEIKVASAWSVTGPYSYDDGNTYQMDNQLFAVGSFIYGSLAAESIPGGITAPGYKFYKSTVTQSEGRQYNPPKGSFDEMTGSFGNVTKGDTVYFAIKDEGSQITVKRFSQTMPSGQTAFDSEAVTTYTK